MTGTGAPITVGGCDVLALCGQLRAWQIDSGYVDIFSVRTTESGAPSRRRFITRLSERAVVFAGSGTHGFEVPAARNGVPAIALVAVPVGTASIRDITTSILSDTFRSRSHLDAITGAIESWVDSISAGVFDGRLPKEHVTPKLSQELLVGPGTPVRNADGIVWAQQVEGASVVSDVRGLDLLAGTRSATPVGRCLWMTPTEPSRLLIESTAERIISGSIWDDLQNFYLLILRAIAAVDGAECAEELERLTEKQAAGRAALTNAVSQLASIMSRDRQVRPRFTDPLLAVCEIVARESGIVITAPPKDEGTVPRGMLERIASASQIRTRRVALRGRWWCEDVGPLIGLRVQEGSDVRSPVALLPRASKSYELVEPITGETTRVDDRTNETLHPFAYVLYRPFIDRALTSWDVLKFAADGSRADFWMILTMGAAGGLLGLLTPILTGVIFNTVIPGAGRTQLAHMVAALFACAVATGLFQLVRGLAVLRVESKMDASVQAAIWDRLLKLPTQFFRRYAAGDLAMRAGAISEIRRMLSGATISSILSGMFSLFNLALLFYYDPGLALLALAITMFALTVMLGTCWAQLRYQREIAKAQSMLSGQVLQYITGITKLRVAGAENKSYERWAQAFAGQRRLQYAARRLGNVLTTFNAAFPVVSMMLVFGVMVGQESPAMPTGDFIAFNGAYGAFTANMLAMTGAFVAVIMSIPAYEQARPILQTLPETSEIKSNPGELIGGIEISQISFRYDPEGVPILDGISLQARPGEFIALVGPSGSGKSTILRLLLGFEQAECGSICFDGKDLSGLDLHAVRRQIGVVLQNGAVMSGDIYTNIAGSSLATIDDAWLAAKMAGLDSDIRSMPMGMHTVVSENGATLSGGQRQRLLIARSIVNRPRLLFFDEATSALDNRTQATVSQSLDRLQATRVVVAHRLSTIINADRIYVLDRGRIVQSGTYATLLEEGGAFAELVRRQTA